MMKTDYVLLGVVNHYVNIVVVRQADKSDHVASVINYVPQWWNSICVKNDYV